MDGPFLGSLGKLITLRSPVCICVMLVSSFLLVLMLVFGPSVPAAPILPPDVPGGGPHVAHNISGTSGQLFSGKVIRKYSGSLLLQTLKESDLAAARASPVSPAAGKCEYWGVVTTIFEPSPAIKEFTARFGSSWCLVVVGDKKTPPYPKMARVTYLPPDAQEAIAPEFVRLLPWNHFGRKNVGFLYAIRQGARRVWDFDDDNDVAKGLLLDVPKSAVELVPPAECTALAPAFNPYPAMGAPKPNWPRGFPLQLIKTPCSSDAASVLGGTASASNLNDVGVFQSLANHDPDVDAIYRLTLPLPWRFTPPQTLSDGRAVKLPAGLFAPYNAQATLHMHSALWTLLLPVTVHGRVSDIWRSYFCQKVMWDVGLRLAFTVPLVEQIRNAHDYIRDLDAETDLYMRAKQLVEFLAGWKGSAATLPGRMEELMVALYERDYIELLDVELTQAWFAALIDARYPMPALTA